METARVLYAAILEALQLPLRHIELILEDEPEPGFECKVGGTWCI